MTWFFLILVGSWFTYDVEQYEKQNPTHELAQTYIDFAYKASKWDEDFVETLDCENWWWTPDRQSDYINGSWRREQSYWFCQMHLPFKKHIIEDPRFLDPYWQITKCLELYQWYKYQFSAYLVRNKCKTNFIKKSKRFSFIDYISRR